MKTKIGKPKIITQWDQDFLTEKLITKRKRL